MPQVRALAQGFDGVCLRNPGEEFDFSGAPAAWFEYLDPKDKEAADAKAVETAKERFKAEARAKYGAEIEAKVRAEMEAEAKDEVEKEIREKLAKQAGVTATAPAKPDSLV